MEITINQTLQRAVDAHKSGNLQDAERLYREILKSQPNHPDANHNLGILAVGAGQLNAALPLFKTALEANPKQGQFWLSYIDTLVKDNQHQAAQEVLEQGRYAGLSGGLINNLEAQLSSNQTLQDRKNLLIALYNDGRFQDVLVRGEAVSIDFPNEALVHNVIGAAHAGLGNHEDAIASYKNALEVKPDYADAYNNLGAALNDAGRYEEAIESYEKALRLKPDFSEAYYNIDNILTAGNIYFPDFSDRWANIFLNLLSAPSAARPKQLGKKICELLKFHPVIQKGLTITSFDGAQPSVAGLCNNLGTLPLLLRTIELGPILDLKIEKLLKGLRYHLLTRAAANSHKEQVLPFQISLALHCFNNEFVFGENDEEALLIEALESQLSQSVNHDDRVDWFSIAALASYRPLHLYGWAPELSCTESLMPLFKGQVQDIQEEASLCATILRLGDPQDQTSVTVREQYEANPYPRWVKTKLAPQPKPFAAVLSDLKLRLVRQDTGFPCHPDILIAGCGTGQHAISTATRFLSCNVLAVDLSLSSLAYAIRKTRELGVTNIDYLQADILDLHLLDRKFDIIESAGVLHHMADPMAGWRVITDCLKPGGLMKIGLYSELARQDIVKAREKIKQLGLSNSTVEILHFRNQVINSLDNNNSVFKSLTVWEDFYSTSEIRDLLFHVQEHRFTLPQINECLDQLGLSFAGFEFSNDAIKRLFREKNPNPDDLFCIDAWYKFELENPDTFRGMYQFWAQNPL